ncbi:MAG: sugar transferase [Candidatus Pacebacteria bacterium]|nr:sugar transferase [Candidatus Paceibacterota bacterium]PIR60691.1 MAG: multidrug MFS transporter [Candidatus Pacebacteria bacterium CG10_big_fil_rev_8_21_14_0_10_44_54]
MTYLAQKRLLDLAVALGLSMLFLPVWLVVPVLIFLDSGKPIFFVHKRVGLNGREFYLYKFRSMIIGADDMLHKHDKKLLREFKSNDWKIPNDPRITKLGKILRSLTIDEFPQLLNVLRGEMSMVGPRAYVRKELDEQSERYPETKSYITKILSVKPGISGPWQTSGRNEIPFAQRAKMDAQYASNPSIWRDILILLKTPGAMISKW